uniref:Uncharacterized protein n=1 Tax=Megaselia scalaris TaxID=36166 RepID=T1H0T0_MEGSC
MFCASNERFQNITEKTKLLAQKCTQQISSHHKPTSQKSKTTDDIEKKNNSTNSFKYLCACTGGTLRSFRRKKHDNGGVGTVRWYVKQPTWRLWGEEREKDAIFTVYLKKVRYHRPTPITAN